MAWSPRTTSPIANVTQPYDWDAETVGECTWYAYWRVQEGGYTPPCWQSGSGSSGTGKYRNAAEWLDHYRNPWVTKSTSYTPVAGDIAVFNTADGFGHVCVIESVSGSTAMISDYNISLNHTFSYRSWTIGGGIGSTGTLLGYLHYPSSTPPGPTPTTTPSVTFSPSSYTQTMTGDENYIDFNYTITVTGIPNDDNANSGISFSSNCYRYAYTSNWVYTTYTVSGVTYKTGTRSLIVRYDRLHDYAYTANAYMYYQKTFSNGSVDESTRMRITINESSGLEEELLAVISVYLDKKKHKVNVKII